MQPHEKLTEFYSQHLVNSTIEGTVMKGECPFCRTRGRDKAGELVVDLDPHSHFTGYFRCLTRCLPGGFAPHFARLLGVDPSTVPGFDPEREPYIIKQEWPLQNINQEIERLHNTMNPEVHKYFSDRAIGLTTLKEMHIGFNGRYLVYPYFQENDCCYSAHCLSAERAGEQFWMGDEKFTAPGQIFNIRDITRCEDGALFMVEGEANLLCLKELGFPGVAVPSATDLDEVDPRRFTHVRTVLMVMSNAPESEMAARNFASRLGFKVRLLQWPALRSRGFNLIDLALENPALFGDAVRGMIDNARAYSPFRRPAREYELFTEELSRQQSESYQAMRTGMPRFYKALGGVHGLNVIGGPPKSGKSTLMIQLATEIAGHEMPVIYYDFENGRQKVYQRTLSRLSKIEVESFTGGEEAPELAEANTRLRAMLEYFRVVNDRKLTPEIMRRHIDFLQHETGREDTVVVIDSLHKLPFKDFAERRTGIDAWLRELESIRDELHVAFLVISELHRQQDGRYDSEPHMGMFKGSGDIEYTADNALVLQPEWQLQDISPESERVNSLWLVASREYSPGRIARYRLDFPFWGFTEME